MGASRRDDRAGRPRPQAPDVSAIRKRSVIVAGHKTSVSLEAPFWEEIAAIAQARGQSIGALVSEIDRTREGNLSSALRLFVLGELRRKLKAERA
jgi:predicted DNA-binding ribbon-helix-helix protein